LDIHSSAWFAFICANRWLGIWLELIAVTFLSIVTFTIVSLNNDVTGGNAGLAISSTLVLSGIFQWGMRQSAETENLMTSVERAIEYTKLAMERSVGVVKPTSNWPRGAIQFRQVCLSYNGVDDILKNLEFDIKEGEKIGIVGRTGAGKSSIISSLFRLTELRSGEILLDGLPLGKMNLSDIRQNISIIPQEPILFSGSIRQNLDPLNLYDDCQIWRAIEEVQMKDQVDSLDSLVTDGGTNFSVGHRQLFCLVRAILRNNKILVLDEATANIDFKTDVLIQNTIRRKFVNCTIITIAHRLHSVMDSDKILVLDNGQLIEYDHPHLLLQNPGSHLYKMVNESKAATANELKEMAEQAFLNQSNL
jgi:ATP-binding cassette subfamily C (CFTR/MRP) protein 4